MASLSGSSEVFYLYFVITTLLMAFVARQACHMQKYIAFLILPLLCLSVAFENLAIAVTIDSTEVPEDLLKTRFAVQSECTPPRTAVLCPWVLLCVAVSLSCCRYRLLRLSSPQTSWCRCFSW
jgi:hypothetical protein